MKKWIPLLLTIAIIAAFFSGNRLTHEMVGVIVAIFFSFSLVIFFKMVGKFN